MKWKKIDDITIFCKKCDKPMIIETIQYKKKGSHGQLFCKECGERIHLTTINEGILL